VAVDQSGSTSTIYCCRKWLDIDTRYGGNTAYSGDTKDTVRYRQDTGGKIQARDSKSIHAGGQGRAELEARRAYRGEPGAARGSGSGRRDRVRKTKRGAIV